MNIDSIKSAKHIVISLPKTTSASSIASANALYTYILTLHLKVSIYSTDENLSSSLDFLPWMSKIKNSYPSSADLEIVVDASDDVVDFFRTNKIKLNKKMATSLYAVLIIEHNGFVKNIDGMTFAWAKELVEAGADTYICTKNLLNYNSLASIRLKAILLQKINLIENGNVAYVELEDADLKRSGATLNDVNIILIDALSLPTVNRVVVKYKNKEIINRGEEV